MPTEPKRGRPTTVDRDAVCLVALKLFEKKGFATVTMEEVADTAKVSRRTLFRLFPTKSDLLWDSLNEVLDGLKARLATTEGQTMGIEGFVDSLFMPALHWLDDPKVAGLVRRRLKIIASEPGLLNHPTLAEMQRVLTSAVSRLKGFDAPPSLIARSLVAMGFASILWWADEGGTTSALEAHRAAIDGFIRLHQRPATTRRKA